MPVVTYAVEFKMPEERAEHQQVMRAPAYYSALCEIVNEFHRRKKHGPAFPSIDEAYDFIWRVLNDEGIGDEF